MYNIDDPTTSTEVILNCVEPHVYYDLIIVIRDIDNRGNSSVKLGLELRA